MIHLYPAEGGHIALKRMKTFTNIKDVVDEGRDTLWISPAFVAFVADTATMIMLPWSKIDNVHVIRKIEEGWDFASG